MNSLPRKPIGHLAVSLILLALLFLPLTTFARVDCTDGTSGGSIGGGGGGGPEGDPLDSNDSGTGGDGDSEIYFSNFIPRGADIWFDGRLDIKEVLFLQIIVIKGVPLISLQLAPSLELQAEASHVR
jgi:hypothetical protein